MAEFRRADTLITPLPAAKVGRGGWTPVAYTAYGTPIDLSELAYLALENPDFGLLVYGQTPPGYDSWSFHEVGGGGVVIIPYVLPEPGGELLIGVVEQNRHNQGGKVLNVPKGTLEPGESHLAAAEREFAEEVGALVQGLELLPGLPMNPNSAFFETARDGEGARFFGLKVPRRLLVTEGGLTVFRKSALVADPALEEMRLAERITGCRFISASEATKLSDMFTVAGVGRLVQHLKQL